MSETQTKEQLLIQNAKLKKENEDYSGYNIRVRKEFAQTFGWRVPKEYGSGTEIRLPSWEEIFVEVGKLLASRNFMDFEGNISELECKLENLEEKIRKEIHPNL